MPVTGITTIDCQYLKPRFAASYLVQDSGRAFFVDNNTAHSVPLLLDALKRAGLKPEQVDYVMITHVHLDHAGGSSLLMKACPNAKLLAHPRAATHVIDPSRLVASARAVYGDQEFERLYGKIEPVAKERVRSIEDEERLVFGAKKLRFFHTRGHANHHMCIEVKEGTQSVVFTGDAFGLAYPDLQKNGLFIFPSTSPTDFDAPEARKSVEKIVATDAEEAFPTHFGGVKDLQGASRQLLRQIDFAEKLVSEAEKSSLPDDGLDEFCLAKVDSEMKTRLEEKGMALSGDVSELLRLDLDLNAQGLAHVARKRRREAKTKKG
jgi:glyoxylase-like metal-dependent hydrolase (beta-lactamase superfamily II)